MKPKQTKFVLCIPIPCNNPVRDCSVCHLTSQMTNPSGKFVASLENLNFTSPNQIQDCPPGLCHIKMKWLIAKLNWKKEISNLICKRNSNPKTIFIAYLPCRIQ